MADEHRSFLAALKKAGAEIRVGHEIAEENGKLLGMVEITVDDPEQAARIVAEALAMMTDGEIVISPLRRDMGAR